MAVSRVLVCVLLAVIGLQAYGYSEPKDDDKCSSYVELGLPPAKGVLFSHACPRAPGWWTRFLLLWAPVKVNVECSHASYKVVAAQSEEGLSTSATAVLCRLRDWSTKNCTFALPPLRNTYFAVQPTDTGLIGPRNLECSLLSSVTDNSHLRLHWVLTTVVLVIVFWDARVLVDCLTFRLASGAVLGICAVVSAFFYIFTRDAPYKRQVGAALAISTSSTVAFMRWFFGVWFPGVDELVHSLPLYIAIGVTGLLATALAYWFDKPGDMKLMNMFTFGLRLTASGAMFATMADWRVAAGIDAVLWSALLVGPVCSGVRALAPVCKPPASPDATAHVRLGQGGLCGLKQRGTHNQQQQQQGSAGWWGTAQVVFGVNTRPQQQMSPAGAAPATAGAGSGGSGGRLGASPLASPKKITNPETGREVAIGGAKYKELLSRGYVADLLRNTLLPPPSPGPGAAAAGRAGAPVASPAANLRHRALGTPQ